MDGQAVDADVPGRPIDLAFSASRRHFNFCRCHLCGHSFLPSFYDHVRVPGWDGHLDEIHRVEPATRYGEAQLFCQACGGVPSLQPQHREWVVHQPDEGHRAVGFRVSPFDAPNIVTVPSLIIASTKYASKTSSGSSLARPAGQGPKEQLHRGRAGGGELHPYGRGGQGTHFIRFDGQHLPHCGGVHGQPGIA